MPAPAASSAIRDGESFLILSPCWLSQTRTLPPAPSAATASRPASGVRTLKYSAGRGGGGSATTSPSSSRASWRLRAPNFLTPGADSPHSKPLASVGTMKMRAHTASSALTTV
jgi:hypothetical protein